MSSNGGFPPLKIIKKNNDNSEKLSKSKERFFVDKKKIVNINNIIEEIKKPMINMNKDEIKIIDSF
jgi:hypothetical protein